MGYFCSQKLICPQCLTRKRSNGKTEHYHVMLGAAIVAPGHTMVVPLMPEFLAPQDGAEKQDCERNGAKRWRIAHGGRLTGLRPVYLGGRLFSCQPLAEAVLHTGTDLGNAVRPLDCDTDSASGQSAPVVHLKSQHPQLALLAEER
jgi:hypothetical protein